MKTIQIKDIFKIALIVIIALLLYKFMKTVSYRLLYEDQVKQTVRDMVYPVCREKE
jgi:hypothetical protein